MIYPTWSNLLSGRADPADPIVVRTPLQQSRNGSSGTFLGECSDGRQRWIKPLNNSQHPRVVISEFIVGSIARLISAPCCEVSVVRIPGDISGWEFRPGAHLVAGLAVGSLAVEAAAERRSLDFRDRDDNRRRHGGLFAIYDWSWGIDDQWLYSEPRDKETYSHDHGHYFPGGPAWTKASLLSSIDQPHELAVSDAGLDAVELGRLADALESITRPALADILREVPLAWPVDTDELDAVGFFLECRAPAAARRLRAKIGGGP